MASYIIRKLAKHLHTAYGSLNLRVLHVCYTFLVYPGCSTVRRTKHSHRTNVLFDEDVIPVSARLEQVREELGDVKLLADGAEAAT